MYNFSEYIGSQFGNPRGIVGKTCCIIMNIINKAMYKKVVSLIDIPENNRILDIGYGNGYLLKLIDKKFSFQMYGIDISEDMKVQAMLKNKKAASENRLHLEVGDCCNLKFDNEFFSAITSVNTVYFWSDISKGLSEIYRCLKKGGIFYNIIYTKDWLDKLSYTKKGFKKFSENELADMGHQAGFDDVRIQEISRGKSFAIIYIK